MSNLIECPKCGAHTPAEIHNSKITCAYCGSSFGATPSAKIDPPNSLNELGYTPDPPPDPNAAPSDKPDEDLAESPDVKTILVEEAALPEQVAKVIDNGRRITRTAIIAVAILLMLCSACFIFGSLGK
jgi:hypothetical protein